MKPPRLFTCVLALFAVIGAAPARANHRTGDLILPGLLRAGDFNEDGNIDLAVCSEGFDHVAILLGDGKGGFTLGGHFSLDTVPKGLEVGDINGDHHLDIISCTIWGYDEILLLGDGKAGFHNVSPPNEIDGDGEPNRILLRDFNKDGHLDIAVDSPGDDKIQFYFGDGQGNFPAPPTEIEGVPRPYAMAAGDLNGDGNLDVVVDCLPGGGSVISVLLGDGAGHFTVSSFPVGSKPASLQVGDLNGDGKPDLVVAGAVPENSSGNLIFTYLGDGQGKFTLAQTLLLGKGSIQGDIALADLNGDGKLDVAFPKSTDQSQTDESTSVLLYYGDGAGNLSPGPVLTVGIEPHTVIAFDLNKDGHLDLAVTNHGDGSVSVLLGDGKGTFTLASTTSILSPLPQIFPAGHR